MRLAGEQQRDSTVHTQVSILPRTLLPSRQPHNSEQSPCWLSILFSHFSFIYVLFIYFKKRFILYQSISNWQCWVISGEQWRDSAIYTHVSILPQTPLPSRLPHNTEQSSLCCAVGPCWLSILNTAVCPCPSQTPWLSLPTSFSLSPHPW